MAKRTCAIEGCDRGAHTRGWCAMHYNRLYAAKAIPVRTRGALYLCSVDGCTRTEAAKGLCDMHYKRSRAAVRPPLRVDLPLIGNRDTGCMEWPGGRNREGYAVVWWGGRQFRANRLVYEAIHGPIPPGMSVCHSCDNRACINSDHLWLGTNADNVRDRDAKGRGLAGETHPNAKLTEESVRTIRQDYAAGISQRETARRLGVHPTTVNGVLRGRNWKHVDATIAS